MTGRTVRIFLADGEPTGILLAEFSNWTAGSSQWCEERASRVKLVGLMKANRLIWGRTE